MTDTNNNRTVVILRWIIFLPCAAIASFLSWYVVILLGRFGLSYVMVDLDSFIAQLYFNSIGHGAMAVAFVWIGFKVAPSNSKNIAYILSGLYLIFSGFTLYTAIMTKYGWAIFGSVWSIVVVIYFAISVYRDEFEL